MKRIVQLYLLFVLSSIVSAQNVFISGNGKDIAGKKIDVYCVEDRLSGYTDLRATTTLGEYDTNFYLSFLTDGTKEIIVQVDLMKYSFVAKPGVKYNLKISDFSFSQEDSNAAFLYGLRLPARLEMERYDGINTPINYVDNLLGEYVYENRRLLFLKDSLTKVGFISLRDSLLLKYKGNEYVENYINYEFESVMYSFYLKSRLATKEEMFAYSPILYDNIGYMDCFQTIFERYFSLGYKYISRKDIESWLLSGNYSAFNDALGRDKVLVNEVFRELVFLQGMKDAYLDGIFDKNLIISILEKFKVTTKFEKHSIIANNLVKYLSTINAENIGVGDYKVKNLDQEEIELKSFFNGKPMLVAFVRLDDVACLKELESIHFCYDSIKDNLNVLTICLDNSFEKMYNFIRNNKVGNKYRWPFVYFNNNYDMTKAFHLRMFPSFILLNEKGEIKENPVDFPSTGELMKYRNTEK